MVDIEIDSNSQFNNRSIVRLGRKDISQSIDGMAIVMKKGKPIQAILIMRPGRIRIKDKSITVSKSEPLDALESIKKLVLEDSSDDR